MNELEFMELLSELPAEYVEAAAAPQPRRTIFRKVYGIPAVAACVAVIIAAVIYPRLRIDDRPDQTQMPDQTAVVTTVALYEETTAAPVSGTEPAVTETVQTGKDAAPEQTATTAQSSVTERTAEDGKQEDDPAQPAASADHAGKTTTARHTDQAAKTSARTTSRTTAHTTVKATTRATTKATTRATTKATTRVTTNAPARTTAATRRTTAATTQATRRTTLAPRVTTAPSTRMTSTNTTRRTTGPAQTTNAPPRTTREPQTTRGPVYTTNAPDTSWAWVTSAPAGSVPQQTDMAPTTTNSSGQQPPVSSGEPVRSDLLPVVFCLFPADESEHYYGETQIALVPAEDMPIPYELSYSPVWDTLDLSQYDCMQIDYYVRCGDAVPETAWRNADDGLTVRLAILGQDEEFYCMKMLVMIPHDMSFDADASKVAVSYKWSYELFYDSLPDDWNYVPFR